MKTLKLTGGARIGMANATFPFATLSVNHNRLDLNASLLGNLSFSPNDVVSIEPYTFLPLIGQGIKIKHKVSSYHQNVIFWSFKNPNWIVEQINETGFLSTDNTIQLTVSDEQLQIKQVQGGFPVKFQFIVFFMVV